MILAFGDSLTNGFGVRNAHSYPAQINKKTDFTIVNAGVDGEFSFQGLQRLWHFLEEKPETVILCHGANDILTRRSTTNLKNNLLSMVQLIKQSGAKTLLIGVPDYYTNDFNTHHLYKEIANETGVLLEDKVLTQIQKNSSLRNDDVHPNEQGYELMADTFLSILNC